MTTCDSVSYYLTSYSLFSWDLQSRTNRQLCIRAWNVLFRNILCSLRLNGLRRKSAQHAQGETHKKVALNQDQSFEGFISYVPISGPSRTMWTTCLLHLSRLAWYSLLYTFIYLSPPNKWISCDWLVIVKVHQVVSPVSNTLDILPYDSFNQYKIYM